MKGAHQSATCVPSDAVVFKAKDRGTGEFVAIKKQMYPHTGASPAV